VDDLDRAGREVDRIRRLQRPKMTAAEAAVRAGISLATWSNYVNGRGVSEDTLWDMAFAVGAEREAADILGKEPPRRRRMDEPERSWEDYVRHGPWPPEVGERLLEILEEERAVRHRGAEAAESHPRQMR
jgi:transcriptional regulator with XRE-family HTH domain